MIIIPYVCQNFVITASSAASYGLNIGAYLIAIANCVVATAAALMLIHE